MNAFSKEAKPQISLSWVSLLRIMVGALFITTWASNLLNGVYTPDGLLIFFTEKFPQFENPLTWYSAFIHGVILPIRHLFAPFQLLTEGLLGLFLLIGLFTPWASAAAAFFIINAFLATFGQDWPWSYMTILGILFVTFFTRSGRSLGLDTRLAARRDKPPLPFLW